MKSRDRIEGGSMNRAYWFRVPVAVFAQRLDVARSKLKSQMRGNKDVLFRDPIELGSCKSTREEMRRRTYTKEKKSDHGR